MRRGICAALIILSLIGICALAGETVTLDVVLMCVVLLLVIGACIVIGDDGMYEAFIKPNKKKNTYMERYRQRLDYAFGKKKNRH